MSRTACQLNAKGKVKQQESGGSSSFVYIPGVTGRKVDPVPDDSQSSTIPASETLRIVKSQIGLIDDSPTVAPSTVPEPVAPILPAAKPVVSNKRLCNIVDALYKGQGEPNQIGSGTSMDALRKEKESPYPKTKNRYHLQKVIEHKKALEKLKKNQFVYNPQDDRVIDALLTDINEALKNTDGLERHIAKKDK